MAFRQAIAEEPTSQSPQVVITQPLTPANLTNYTEYYEAADTKVTAPKEAAPAVEVNCNQGCGCGTCDRCCGKWILGLEAVWLSPQFHDTQFAAVEFGAVRDDPLVAESALPQGLYITPRITLGYQGECWGIQTRYWRMSETNSVFQPGTSLDYSSLTSNNSFFAETADLEATRLFCWQDTTNLFSFGVRYAQLNEFTGVHVIKVVDEDITEMLGSARHKFAGTGFTVGLAGYKPLPCRNFNLFYSARGSIVWDPNTNNSVETKAVVLDNGSAADIHAATACHTGDLFIGEVQIGAQWNFALCQRCSDAFVRCALEYQYWGDNKTGSAAAGSLASDSDVYSAALASTSDTRFDLIGFTVATGFSW